jgi:peptide/nickel transport system substrate-binding protein
MSSREEFRRRRVPTVAWIAAIAGIVVIAVVLVVVLSGGSDDSEGPTNNAAAKATTGGGSLTVAALSSPDPLDPHINAPTYARAVRTNVYEPLLRYKPGGIELEPALAEKFEVSEDALTYTFTLRDGVKFHDGTPMDSDDVQASFQRTMTFKGEPSMGGIYLTDVDSTSAPDPKTFVVKLKKPYSLFPGVVPKIAIASSDDITQHAGKDEAQTWFKENANGTGPFKFGEYRHGVSYTLTRNTDYWRETPDGAYDRILVRVIDDSARQAQLLQRGDLDYGSGMSFRDMTTADKSDKVKLIKPSPYATMTLIGSLNAGRAPLNDKKVRQAIIAAFPYPEMRDFYQGFGVETTNLLASSYPGSKQFPPLAQNLDEAKTLLADAGYGPGGKKLTLRYVAFQGLEDTRQAGLLLQDALDQIGVKLDVEVLPFPTFFEQAQDVKTAPDISPGYESPETNDPFFWMRKLTGTKGFYNLTFNGTKELDDTLEAGQAEPDDAAREQVLAKAQDLIAAEASIIPMAAFDQPGISTADVEGVQRNFTELLDVPDYYPMFNGAAAK